MSKLQTKNIGRELYYGQFKEDLLCIDDQYARDVFMIKIYLKKEIGGRTCFGKVPFVVLSIVCYLRHHIYVYLRFVLFEQDNDIKHLTNISRHLQ